ncbi:hypothetical protein BUZ39_11580 [Staphylococcus haemolyticus]|nr:hypothetical protein BUZ39_11580 [Staphylococcus haemolyticus]
MLDIKCLSLNKKHFMKKCYKLNKLGVGPQQREFHQEILQAKQAGSGRRILKEFCSSPILLYHQL